MSYGLFITALAETVIDKVDNYKYKQSYTKCYDILKPYAEQAVEAKALDGIGKASRKLGEAIGKLPIADKISVDEGLVALGNKVDAFGDRKAEETMKAFKALSDSNVSGFIDNIQTLNKMHNEPIEVLYYNDKLMISDAI